VIIILITTFSEFHDLQSLTWGDSYQWQNQWSPLETSSTAPYANWTPPAKGKGDQWQNQWSPLETSSTAPYANWTQPAKGKGHGRTKVDPLWCDIHQVNGHSTDWCFDNPYRTGGKPLATARPWCDSCNSYGHTSDTCYTNSPRPTSKSKGKGPTSKGKGDKGNFGNRNWKSQNFPAAYSSDQATPALHDDWKSQNVSVAYSSDQATPPALHDEGPTTKSIQWWDDNELGSVCFDVLTIDKGDNLNDDYNDDDIAEEIDLYFLAILKNMERQKGYLKAPTAAALHVIAEHEGFIMQAFSQLNVHSQRIITTFKSQIGYESCMDTLIKNYTRERYN
jgi:hypothetical protein